MSVLSEIIAQTRADLRERKSCTPLSELKQRCKDAPPIRSLKTALAREFAIIAEIKERSPSAGEMNPTNVRNALKAYNDSPAIGAISVLTDEPFFGGSLDCLWRTRARTAKPILRKDFIVDEYQVWEARAHGADAILLMVAVHADNPSHLADLHAAAVGLGLECLVEIGMSHVPADEQSHMVPEQAQIWGINSRKFDSTRLKIQLRASQIFGRGVVRQIFGRDITTDSARHQELRDLIPEGKIAVAESGIHAAEELRALAGLNFNAALIGTAFLRGPKSVKDVVHDFTKVTMRLRRESSKAAAHRMALQRA